MQPANFERHARSFNVPRIVFESIVTALSLVQALAWKDAFDVLLKDMLPIAVYGAASAFLFAMLVTLICVVGVAFVSRTYGVCQRHMPTAITLEVVDGATAPVAR